MQYPRYRIIIMLIIIVLLQFGRWLVVVVRARNNIKRIIAE